MNNYIDKSKLFIVGGGGHAISCLDVILSAGGFELIGFVDNTAHTKMASLGYEYLGDDSEIEKLIQSECAVTIELARFIAPQRQNMYEMLNKHNAKMPVICAPTSYVSTGARLGDATMVFHNAVVNIGVK